MKNKFIVGAFVGMSSLALAVPLLAQISSAQEVPSSATQGQLSQADAPDQGFDIRKGGHIGVNGDEEELLTGDDADKVSAAALGAVPGGVIDRMETDAEGDAYEAHMTKVDGSHATVKFDDGFDVKKIEDEPTGGRGHEGRFDDDLDDDADDSAYGD